MAFLWSVCVRFVMGYLFVLFVLFTGLMFVFFLCWVYAHGFPFPFFFSYKTVLTERTKRKERDTHPYSRPKKMGKRIQTIPSLSISPLCETTANLSPHLKNTHNAAIQASPPAPPAAVASSQGAPLLSGESCFCRGFLAESSGTTTQISTSHLPVLKVFPRAVLSRNLRFVCIVWSVRG